VVAAAGILGALPSCTAGGPLAERTSGARPTVPARLDDPVVATGAPAADAALDQVARAVEDARGLHFRSPVRVEVLPEAAFQQRIGAVYDAESAGARVDGRILTALGEIPPTTDYVTVGRRVFVEEVIGLYSPEDKVLLVLGDPASPATRATVAHELTHALDDQWFGLDRADDDDDAMFARSALAEGSAMRVESAYMDSLSTDERVAAEVEESDMAAAVDLSGLPPEMFEGLEDAYGAGSTYVTWLERHGGQAALDAAFRAAHLTSEDVLHRRRPGAAPPAVAEPPADGTVFDRGALGEIGVLDLLNTAMAPARAREAAEGWDGDRYVAWDGPGGSACVRVDLRVDDPADRQELASALAVWAAQQPAASVSLAGELLRITSCR
jgi:hypothetical protein